jgi:methylenetetrahydrofolate dehydrogenase (NADP+)/methenyltetrahydrofolate cyclohydrolase
MSVLLDGRAIAARIRETVKTRVTSLTSTPKLDVILVGDDAASHLYVSLKKKACEEAGIAFELHLLAADEPEHQIVALVERLGADRSVTGILVQLPLPSQDPDRIIAAIPPVKDVDGFHSENLERLARGEPGIVPALALGIMKLIDEAKRETNPRSCAIVGSAFFARPIGHLLSEHGITPTIVDPDDAELAAKTRGSDILIVAVGRPGLITAEAVKPGAIVIDVGTTRVDDKVVGDVDASNVNDIAGYLTPVPGGVGPMTVAMLLLNILKAHSLQNR